MCDKTVQLCEELETLAKASPLSNIISDSIAQKIAMPKNYFSDRSHLVSENFGFDEVRLNSLTGFKSVLAQKNWGAIGVNNDIDLLELSLASFDIIKKIAIQANDDLRETALFAELLSLKDHPWFACLQGLDAENNNSSNDSGLKTSNNNESVPDTTEVGGNDDDGDSGGWTCLQCEEENEEDDTCCFLCAADRPSTDNDMSTLLLHAVCVQNELQSLLFFILSLIIGTENPEKMTLKKSSINKAMSVLEKTSRPTPEALCKELENYIVRQREKMIQVPKRMLSIGGRLLISDSSITSTSGNNIVPGVVIATGFEIYDCKDIIIKANSNNNNNSDNNNNVGGNTQNTVQYSVSIAKGEMDVKIGWMNPTYAFDMQKVNTLLNLKETEGYDNERKIDEDRRTLIEVDTCSYEHGNIYKNADKANGYVEQTNAFSTVLLSQSIPRGRSRVVSVTLKLGVGPGSTPCNKWAVVVVRRVSTSSRGFKLLSRSEIIVDETKLMEKQTVKLDRYLNVRKGDYIGVSNPYGKLGLCCLAKDATSRETFYVSPGLSWDNEGSSIDLSSFALSNPNLGKSCLGLSFRIEPEPISEISYNIGNYYEKLIDEKVMHVFDAGKNIQFLLGDTEMLKDNSKKGDSSSLSSIWNTNGKENRVISYLTPSNSGGNENKVSIGYKVNNHDIGIIFDQVIIDRKDGLVPVVIFYKEKKTDEKSEATEPDEAKDDSEIHESQKDNDDGNNAPTTPVSGLISLMNNNSQLQGTPPTPPISALSGNNNNNDNDNNNTLIITPSKASLTPKKKVEKQTRIYVNLNIKSLASINSNKKKVEQKKGKSLNQDVKVEKYAGSYLNFSLNAYLSANIADEKRTGIVGDSSIEILFRPSQAYISHLQSKRSSISFKNNDNKDQCDGYDGDENSVKGANLTFDVLVYSTMPKVGLCVSIASDGRLYCFLKSSNTYCFTKRYRVQSSSWRHLSISVQTCLPTIYIDGVEVEISRLKKIENVFDNVWSDLDNKFKDEVNIEKKNFFAGSLFTFNNFADGDTDSAATSLDGWEGDICDIRVWKVARSSKDVSRNVGRTILKSFPMYYEEAFQSKGLIGYFPFIEKRSAQVHNFCHYLHSNRSGTVSGGKYKWQYGSYLIKNGTNNYMTNDSISQHQGNNSTAINDDGHGDVNLSYTYTTCIDILLRQIGHRAEKYYVSHLARFEGRGLGNLYNIVPPRLVVQTTNLTFQIITKLLKILVSGDRMKGVPEINKSMMILNILKILLGNIYHVRSSKEVINAFQDGSLQSILEVLIKDNDDEISKHAILNLSVGIKLFFEADNGGKIQQLLINWSDNIEGNKNDSSSLNLFVSTCKSIMEQENLVKSFVSDFEIRNPMDLLESLLSASFKAGSIFSHDDLETLIKFVRTLQDCLILHLAGNTKAINSDRTDHIEHVSKMKVLKSYSSFLKDDLIARGESQEIQYAVFDPNRRGSNLKISEDGSSVTSTRKSWGTCCVRTKGFGYKSGVYRFVIHVEKLGKDGYAFIGLLFNGGDLNRFVGADVQGYGRGFLLCRGTTWQKGSQSNEQFRKFGAGSKLEFIVDTDEGYGTVQICDAESGENYGVIMTNVFKGIERGVCYPAVSPYEVGDKITVISCRHIKSRRTKYRLYTPRLAVQKNISNDNLENAAERNLIQLMSTMTDRLLESSFEDESVILILHYLFHPLISYYSTNAIFPLPEGNKVLQKIFLVLEKLIRNVKDIETLNKASPRNDVIFDNILSLFTFISKVAAYLFTYTPSNSKLLLPNMAELFNEPLIEAIVFSMEEKQEAIIGSRERSFRNFLTENDSIKTVFESLKQFALKLLNYKPAFVITRGNEKHDKMVFFVVIGVLHHCRWSYFDTIVGSDYSPDVFSLLFSRMDEFCKEQLLLALKTALDVKSLVLRQNDEKFVDRLILIAKSLVSINIANKQYDNLFSSMEESKNIANSFKNMILKHALASELSNTLPHILTEVQQIIDVRKKGALFFAKAFSTISLIGKEDTPMLANLKVLLYAIACNEMPRIPWHCDTNVQICSKLLKKNLRNEVQKLANCVLDIFTEVLQWQNLHVLWKFNSFDNILPIISRVGAISVSDMEYNMLISKNVLQIMNVYILTEQGEKHAHAEVVKLFYYFCLQIKQVQNTLASNELILSFMWEQVQFVAKNCEKKTYCTALEENLIDVLLIFSKGEESLLLFRRQNSGWIQHLIVLLQNSAKYGPQISLVSLMINIMSVMDVTVSSNDDTVVQQLDVKGKYGYVEWAAVIVILIEECFMTFNFNIDMRKTLSLGFQSLVQKGTGVGSIVSETLVGLIKNRSTDHSVRDSINELGKHALTIFSHGQDNFLSWKFTKETLYEINNELLARVKQIMANNDNIDKGQPESTATVKRGALSKDKIINAGNKFIADAVNFLYLSFVNTREKDLLAIINLHSKCIFDIATNKNRLYEDEKSSKTTYHYSAIPDLEKKISSSLLRKGPTREERVAGMTHRLRPTSTELGRKNEAKSPLFDEVDFAEYEPCLRYAPFKRSQSQMHSIHKSINTSLMLMSLYAQRLLAIAFRYDCHLENIKAGNLIQMLHRIMICDHKCMNAMYLNKLITNSSLFPTVLIDLISKEIEQITRINESAYIEKIIIYNSESCSKNVLNISLMKQLTLFIITKEELVKKDTKYSKKIHLTLVKAWVSGLQSRSMVIKEKVFNALSSIMSAVHIIPDAILRQKIQIQCLNEIPTADLVELSIRRMGKEMEYYPLISTFCQSLMRLISILDAASKTDSIIPSECSADSGAVIGGVKEKFVKGSDSEQPNMTDNDVDKTSDEKDNTKPKDGGGGMNNDTVPFQFDSKFCHQSIKLSDNGICAEANANDHCIVIGNRGFDRGIHYWSVKLTQMEWGKTYIGVTEKPVSLNGWPTSVGYGLVTYRATHARGQETMYGTVLRTGDTVGVLLDMDCGTISFFKEGEDAFTGQRVFQDMGIAYHNIRTRNGKAKSNVTLYPCIGFGRTSSKVTLKDCKFLSCETPSINQRLKTFSEANDIFSNWISYRNNKTELPFLDRIFEIWKKWKRGRYFKGIIRNRENVIAVIEEAFNNQESGKVMLDGGGERQEATDDTKNNAAGSQMKLMSFDDFKILSTFYTLKDDLEMIGVINKICDENNKNPFDLKELPFDQNIDAREIQFCSYLYFNSYGEIFFPFINVASSDSKNKIEAVRGLIFNCLKLRFWNEVLVATTTATRPPEDEWDKPSEIPQLALNRVGATSQILQSLSDTETRFKKSLFGQLKRFCNTWESRHWRRSYQHVTDKGQSRAFFAKFLGENVDDNGGPYRAVFVAAVCDEPSQALDLLDSNGCFKYSSLEGNVEFFGKLIGLAIRHKMLLSLPFASYIWHFLVGTDIDDEQRNCNGDDGQKCVSGYEICRSIQYMDEEETLELITEIVGSKETKDASEEIKLSVTNEENDSKKQKYLKFLQEHMLKKKSAFLDKFINGLSISLPTQLFPMFTAGELKSLMCGDDTINLTLLQKVAVYDDGIDANEAYILNFWKVLFNMSDGEKSKFINFVYAKKRLPASISGFIMPFKILKPLPYMKEAPDNFLPHAKTCFFELAIPKYTSIDICREKILYAINNCITMEDYSSGSTDFVL